MGICGSQTAAMNGEDQKFLLDLGNKLLPLLGGGKKATDGATEEQVIQVVDSLYKIPSFTIFREETETDEGKIHELAKMLSGANSNHDEILGRTAHSLNKLKQRVLIKLQDHNGKESPKSEDEENKLLADLVEARDELAGGHQNLQEALEACRRRKSKPLHKLKLLSATLQAVIRNEQSDASDCAQLAVLIADSQQLEQKIQQHLDKVSAPPK